MGEKERMATIGAFDGVHRGHCDMLRQLMSASQNKGLAPTVVTFRRHPLETIRPEDAPPLLMTAEERFGRLRSINGLEVIELDFTPEIQRMTAAEFMKMLRDKYDVKAVFMGYNHRFGSDRLALPEEYDAIGAGLGMEIVHGIEMAADGEKKISSSAIRRSLLSGDVVSAAGMLGRPYAIRGVVVAGKQLGRRIGFPTANIRPVDGRLLVPAAGVYACRVVLSDGDERGAMVNIGVRPTVDRDEKITIEAHIFDFTGDVYGQTVTLKFIARLRDERRFPSVDSLRAQLERDACAARSALSGYDTEGLAPTSTNQ